jgi:hypothetical protein
VSPVKYEQGSYIPEDDILHSQNHENVKSYNENRISRLSVALPLSYAICTAPVCGVADGN